MNHFTTIDCKKIRPWKFHHSISRQFLRLWEIFWNFSSPRSHSEKVAKHIHAMPIHLRRAFFFFLFLVASARRRKMCVKKKKKKKNRTRLNLTRGPLQDLYIGWICVAASLKVCCKVRYDLLMVDSGVLRKINLRPLSPALHHPYSTPPPTQKKLISLC